jgi:hypothetical protein
MLPFLDRFGRTRLSSNDCLSLRPELPKRFAMAMIWLVLRYHDNVRLLNLRKVLYAWRNVVAGACKP